MTGQTIDARSGETRVAGLDPEDESGGALQAQAPNTVTPTTNAPLAETQGRATTGASIVDRSRALIVATLDNAASRYPTSHGSHLYLNGMARKVEAAEATAIDSYLVLDAVIAALKSAYAVRDDIIRAMEESDPENDPATYEKLADIAIGCMVTLTNPTTTPSGEVSEERARELLALTCGLHESYISDAAEWLETYGSIPQDVALRAIQAALSATPTVREVERLRSAVATFKPIMNCLGMAEWADSKHAENILSTILNDYYPAARIALQGDGL